MKKNNQKQIDAKIYENLGREFLRKKVIKILDPQDTGNWDAAKFKQEYDGLMQSFRDIYNSRKIS